MLRVCGISALCPSRALSTYALRQTTAGSRVLSMLAGRPLPAACLRHPPAPIRTGLSFPVANRNFWSTAINHRLRVLQEEANKMPSDASRQVAFMEACNRYKQPRLAVQRYESGQFAVNEGVVKEYIKSLATLKRLDQLNTTDMMHRLGMSLQQEGVVSPQAGTGAVMMRGTREDPMHIHWQEPDRSQAWKTIRVMAVLGMIAAAGMSFMDERGMPKGLGFSTEVQPVVGSTKKFADVVGVDEAKSDLQEIVQYLRNPNTFTRLGGKLPKGMLLTGPPGTGKTLLARAVAGEAGVPFFYMSGSEFEEVFVGVGARRVRDLFAAAKRRAPCIIFVDEIDAIGSHRNPKEQQAMKMTLNQLLVELDGFNQNQGVIVLGATNFPEVLDRALVRPGRFDQTINVPLPDIRGRLHILQFYAKPIPLAEGPDLEVIARATPGMSGADLSNLINMAALKASMDGKNAVEMSDLEFAVDKIRMGAERKSAQISDENRKLTAYHEGGHALVSLNTNGALPIHKATIMPRGRALGMVSYLPKADQMNYSRQQMLAHLDVCMGGRLAEELIFGKMQVTSGASSDLSQATSMARDMITKFGMSETIGPVYYSDEEVPKLSTSMREQIDSEVKQILGASEERVRTLLKAKQKELHLLAKGLLAYETLDREEINQVLKGKPIDLKLPKDTNKDKKEAKKA